MRLTTNKQEATFVAIRTSYYGRWAVIALDEMIRETLLTAATIDARRGANQSGVELLGPPVMLINPIFPESDMLHVQGFDGDYGRDFFYLIATEDESDSLLDYDESCADGSMLDYRDGKFSLSIATALTDGKFEYHDSSWITVDAV